MRERRGARSHKEPVTPQKSDETSHPRANRDLSSSLLQDTPKKRSSNLASFGETSSIRSTRRKSTYGLPDVHNETTITEQSIIGEHFVDTPKHLYGLDNPVNSSEALQDNPEILETKQEEDPKHESRLSLKFFQLTLVPFLGFVVFISAVSIGVMVHNWNKNANETIENALWQQEIDPLKEQIYNIKEQIRSIESRQVHILEQLHRAVHDVGNQKESLDYQSFKVFDGQWKQVVDRAIEIALARWDADKIGIADYALESAGGHIHSPYHSSTFTNGAPQVLLFGVPLWYDVKTPRVVIQRGNNPGECWAFKGQEGYIVIKLSQTIRPMSFTLEHMPASLSQFADKSTPSAPKKFSVWGWSDEEGHGKTLLGEYMFNSKKRALETFPVQVCRTEEVRYIVSPYKSDAQIAVLVSKGYADFAMTEDSDLLAYGCNKTILKSLFFAIWCKANEEENGFTLGEQ